VGLYIGDVCGKGLPAALFAALTVGTLRGVHKT
jgi:serine phosphatase RsbU (regulator of sigma subunit)